MIQHVMVNDQYRGVRLEPTKELCVDQCGAKCCRHPIGYLSMTTKEMRRFKELGKERLGQNFKMEGSPKPGYWIFKFEEHGGACQFLDQETNMCTIYEDRPDGCRRYPVTRDDICPLWLRKASDEEVSMNNNGE